MRRKHNSEEYMERVLKFIGSHSDFSKHKDEPPKVRIQEYKDWKRNNSIEFNTGRGQRVKVLAPPKLIALWTVLLSALFLLFVVIASAEDVNTNSGTINQNEAVRCLIGEAANQGYHGLLVLAEALRNRGTTRGVYGCGSPHVDKEPRWVWDMAHKAWRESAGTNFTNGADHWENIKAFGKPWWADKMDKTYEHKDHVFYKAR